MYSGQLSANGWVKDGSKHCSSLLGLLLCCCRNWGNQRGRRGNLCRDPFLNSVRTVGMELQQPIWQTSVTGFTARSIGVWGIAARCLILHRSGQRGSVVLRVADSGGISRLLQWSPVWKGLCWSGIRANGIVHRCLVSTLTSWVRTGLSWGVNYGTLRVANVVSCIGEALCTAVAGAALTSVIAVIEQLSCKIKLVGESTPC